MSSSSRKFRRRRTAPVEPRDWPPGDTKTTLVRDLEQKPQSVLRDRLILRAKAGHYHDFETPLATPKVTLVKDLANMGFDDLAQKVKDGGYDHEPPTEEQKAELVGMLVGEGVCRVCGCTDDDCRQCFEKLGHPCKWVGPNLCSACAT